MTIDEQTLNQLTDLVLIHDVSPVAHRELIALLRRASGWVPGPDPGDSTSASERYEMLGMLGTGAMGEVLRVLDPDMGRTVAMKVMLADKITPSRTSRFVSEARTLASLQHPGIVPIYELGHRSDGRRYFTMPEIKGSTFAKRISMAWCASTVDELETLGVNVDTMPATYSVDVRRRRLIDMLVQAADAVGFAHSRGVIHRDLKPHNIMVGDHGEVFVVDWGIAKVFASEGDTLPPDSAIFDVQPGHQTAVGAIVGTPMYMAPEQILDRGTGVGPPADVFALGAMLLELLTGRRPRSGSSSAALLRQARRGAFDTL
ncbi:MAG: serine/threonine protein kinase, partial [Kiritimatiellia bacterium]